MPLQQPAFGTPLKSAHASEAMREALLTRRSTQADLLGSPGPDQETIQAILTAAARVPDHRRVCPYRFILFTDNAREKAGTVLESRFQELNPDATSEQAAKEGGRFLRAPLVVAVVSVIDAAHRTPEWEQILTAGAVCQNMLLAASAHGFAAQWLTEWYAYDPVVLENFAIKAGENVAGFIYIGTAKENPKERRRPDLEGLITTYDGG